MLSPYFSISLVLLVCGTAMAEEGKVLPPSGESATGRYYGGNRSGSYHDPKKEGFYFYKDPEEAKKEEKKREEKAEVKSQAPEIDPFKMPADDFKKLLDDTRKRAVQSPTEENVMEYIKLHDIARRKARAFTNVYLLTLQKHPEYNVSAQYPDAVPGRAALYSEQSGEIRDTLNKSSEEFALIYLYNEPCRLCEAQDRVMTMLSGRYPEWNIRRVNVDENRDIAERLKITSVPSTILVFRQTGEHIPVSAGVVSLGDLTGNIHKGIRYLRGEISAEQFSTYDSELGGVFDPAAVPKD